MSTESRLPDTDVKVKVSLCGKCNGIIRAAVEHQMTKGSKRIFANEVMEYNLSVKSISLEEYRNGTILWCECTSPI